MEDMPRATSCAKNGQGPACIAEVKTPLKTACRLVGVEYVRYCSIATPSDYLRLVLE